MQLVIAANEDARIAKELHNYMKGHYYEGFGQQSLLNNIKKDASIKI